MATEKCEVCDGWGVMEDDTPCRGCGGDGQVDADA